MTYLDIETQNRCPNCDNEIYGPAVYAFSHGEAPCHSCGKHTKPMNTNEYREALSALRAAKREQKPGGA
jgi:hypothetical protein